MKLKQYYYKSTAEFNKGIRILSEKYNIVFCQNELAMPTEAWFNVYNEVVPCEDYSTKYFDSDSYYCSTDMRKKHNIPMYMNMGWVLHSSDMIVLRCMVEFADGIDWKAIHNLTRHQVFIWLFENISNFYKTDFTNIFNLFGLTMSDVIFESFGENNDGYAHVLIRVPLNMWLNVLGKEFNIKRDIEEPLIYTKTFTEEAKRILTNAYNDVKDDYTIEVECISEPSDEYITEDKLPTFSVNLYSKLSKTCGQMRDMMINDKSGFGFLINVHSENNLLEQVVKVTKADYSAYSIGLSISKTMGFEE